MLCSRGREEGDYKAHTYIFQRACSLWAGLTLQQEGEILGLRMQDTEPSQSGSLRRPKKANIPGIFLFWRAAAADTGISRGVLREGLKNTNPLLLGKVLKLE